MNAPHATMTSGSSVQDWRLPQTVWQSGTRLMGWLMLATTVLAYCVGTPALFAAEPQAKFVTSQNSGTITGKLVPATVAPGETAELQLLITPDALNNWYFYYFSPTGERTTRLGIGFPTIVWVDPHQQIETGPVKPSVEPIVDDHNNHVFPEPLQLTIPVKVKGDAATGKITVTGSIGLQICQVDGQCLQEAATFSVELQVAEMRGTDQGEVRFLPSRYNVPANLLKAQRTSKNQPPQIPPPDTTATTPLPSPQNTEPPAPTGVLTLPNFQPLYFDSGLEGGVQSLGYALIWGFLGGILLNLMPCVLPVIGLKVMSFVNQAGHHRGRIFLLNLAYTMGILLVFLALALAAVFLGLGWGDQFQSQAFNVAMISIVFAMSLSFLGVWEIPIPGFAASGTLAEASTQEGYLGAVMKGVLTTLLATPCSGPFLGSVFAYALKNANTQPWQPIGIFMSIGLGLAFPYLMIGVFPGLVKLLPKPGAWMDTFKQIMGFVLLGTVVLLFSNLKSEYFLPTLSLQFAIWFALWWVGQVPIYADLSRRLFAWLTGGAVAAVIGWGAFAWFLNTHTILEWRKYTHAELLAAAQNRQTVMVDFTAEWCQTCKVNLLTAIDTNSVNQLVKEYQIVPLKADKTDEVPEIEELLSKLDRTGIPLLAIFPANDPTRPIVIDGLLTQQQVLDALRKAGPSQTPLVAVGQQSRR
ncbi:MAG: cytochrome c biogenesis protein CcdA [Pirellulales bacterium]|nr:cytochrome c biogenesis protein CcdA [Pirellulales bacterium]